MATSQVILRWQDPSFTLSAETLLNYHQGSECVVMPDKMIQVLPNRTLNVYKLLSGALNSWENNRAQVKGHSQPLPKLRPASDWNLLFTARESRCGQPHSVPPCTQPHYPDLLITGSVTLSNPIREALFCCIPHKLLFCTTLPQREEGNRCHRCRGNKCHTRTFLRAFRFNADILLVYVKSYSNDL